MTRRTFHQLAAAGVASAAVSPPIAFDPKAGIFTIDNGVIQKRLRVDGANGLLLEHLSLAGGRNWAAQPSRWGSEIYTKTADQTIFGARLAYQDHAVTSEELRIRLAGRGLETVLVTRVFPGLAVLEQWVEVRNSGSAPVELERFDPLLVSLALPGHDPCEMTWLQGCQDYGYGRGIGTNLQRFGPFRVRRASLDPNDSRTLLNTAPNYSSARTSTSSLENVGWFSIQSGGEGIFGGLQWSGEWALDFARTDSELVVHGGVHNFSRNLPPGEKLVSPHSFLGLYRGDVDRGVHEMHNYLRAHVMPAAPDSNFPWTCYNTWYNWSIGLEELVLKREVEAAARLGLECFYLDAGWWTGSPPRGGFGKALGAWTENREKFPAGIRAFGDVVKGSGMKFGLWVEPERIDAALPGDGKDQLREAWLAQRDGAPLRRGDNTHQLCFGCPDAVEWIERKLLWLVGEYGVDWLKWDHNFYLPCNRGGHGHQRGDGGFTHIQGVYRVMGRLRERFPKLVIESCSGGGNRIDFGMLRYALTNWTSDDTTPSYRVRYHSLGASYAFPAQYQNSWYIASGRKQGEPVSDATPGHVLDYLFRSRMMGAFGISDRIAGWPSNIQQGAIRAVSEYKKMRPILTAGDVYHVLPQPVLWVPPLEPPRQWEAIEYFHPKLDRGVILVFRAEADPAAVRIPIRGLEPAHRYVIRSANTGRAETHRGREWTDGGAAVELPAKPSSDILWIEPA